MREPLENMKSIPAPTEYAKCDTCGKEMKLVLFVEELDKSFCIFCYQNRYGLERTMRKLHHMKPDEQILAFVSKELADESKI